MEHFYGWDPNHLVQRPALKKRSPLWTGWVTSCVFPAQTIIAEKTVSEVEVDDWVWTDESDTDQMLQDGLKHQFLPGTQMTSIFEGRFPQNKAFSNQNKGHLGSR